MCCSFWGTRSKIAKVSSLAWRSIGTEEAYEKEIDEIQITVWSENGYAKRKAFMKSALAQSS